MPLHTIGLNIPKSFYGLTTRDAFTVVLAVLFYAQPGIDREGLMQWLIDHVFFGSIALCSILGVFVSHKLLEWGGLLFYSLIYYLEDTWPAFRAHASKHHANPIDPWPWARKNKEVEEKKYHALRVKSTNYIIIYHIIVTIVQFLILLQQTHWSVFNPMKWEFSWEWLDTPDTHKADPATLPSRATVAYQCLVSTLVAETGFYWAHRMLHSPYLYYFHKRHHEYNNQTTVWATFYVGLLDSILTDFIPAGFGIIYFNMHIWTIWMYTLPLILNALFVHCGYDNAALWCGGYLNPIMALPFCSDAERTHDLHHRYNNCNFGGAYFIFDRLFGTFRNPDTEQLSVFNKKLQPTNIEQSNAEKTD